MYKYFLFLFLIGCAASRTGQQQHATLVNNLQKHVAYLADDKLEGRRTGSAGEQLAAEYISAQFQQTGLEPKGSNGYFQPFQVDDGKVVDPSTRLVIDGKTLRLNEEFFPFAFSATDSLHAMPSIALNENDMPWFLDLKDVLKENESNPHFDLQQTIVDKAVAAGKKGAAAMIVYNTGEKNDELKFDGRSKTAAVSIPVVYIQPHIARSIFADPSAMLDLQLTTRITSKTRTGHNVAGFINNNSATTIVIGAHYDHLGFGEDHNSRHTGSDLQIHNGADNNASGTAAMIELARKIKGSDLKKNNYLFVAFSGEELGLYGSKYFTQHPPVPLDQINYMINMDMVGRLNDSSKLVTVGGYGTSPAWGNLYGNSTFTTASGLVFRYDSSGTGPSDHTSFYLKEIPVLFYFTGLHTDYHKPSDDFDKVNYQGTAMIVEHIFSLIKNTNSLNKLAFTKTRETQTSTSARFSVSMGIMPDYTFSGNGVRVDGVTENKPAEKAGLKAGDIILSLGDHKTPTVEAYMQALGKFKKGDRTIVSFTRNNKNLSASVEF